MYIIISFLIIEYIYKVESNLSRTNKKDKLENIGVYIHVLSFNSGSLRQKFRNWDHGWSLEDDYYQAVWVPSYQVRLILLMLLNRNKFRIHLLACYISSNYDLIFHIYVYFYFSWVLIFEQSNWERVGGRTKYSANTCSFFLHLLILISRTENVSMSFSYIISTTPS